MQCPSACAHEQTSTGDKDAGRLHAILGNQ
jgi:hypothetical protein